MLILHVLILVLLVPVPKASSMLSRSVASTVALAAAVAALDAQQCASLDAKAMLNFDSMPQTQPNR